MSKRASIYAVRIVDRENGIEWCEEVEPTRSGEFIGENLPLRETLQLVINALNGKELYYPGLREDFSDYDRMLREAPPILRRIVKAWQRYREKRFGLSRLFKANPSLRDDVSRYWRETRTALTGAEIGGGAAIALESEPGRTAYGEALRFFVLLVTNPLCADLAGPCKGCDKYFVRESAKNTDYCSSSCGSRTTAMAATKKRRDDERNDKLARASRRAREWTTMLTSLDWKQWVSRAEPDITPKFLTRAVNEGELKMPIRQKEKRG